MKHPAGDAVAAGNNGSLAQGLPVSFRCKRLGGRHIAVDIALAYCDRSVIGAAKPGSRFGHCVQHRLDISGRAADDLEHIAGRGLGFERLVALGSAFGKLALQIGCELLAIG
jgi:hypothetical protein